jgi:hypothetical protein
MAVPMPGFTTLYPRGQSAVQGSMPDGYVMVSRWASAPEVKLWMANGGSFLRVSAPARVREHRRLVTRTTARPSVRSPARPRCTKVAAGGAAPV